MYLKRVSRENATTQRSPAISQGLQHGSEGPFRNINPSSHLRTEAVFEATASLVSLKLPQWNGPGLTRINIFNYACNLQS